jgi:hypothetical protein
MLGMKGYQQLAKRNMFLAALISFSVAGVSNTDSSKIVIYTYRSPLNPFGSKKNFKGVRRLIIVSWHLQLGDSTFETLMILNAHQVCNMRLFEFDLQLR